MNKDQKARKAEEASRGSGEVIRIPEKTHKKCSCINKNQ